MSGAVKDREVGGETSRRRPGMIDPLRGKPDHLENVAVGKRQSIRTTRAHGMAQAMGVRSSGAAESSKLRVFLSHTVGGGDLDPAAFISAFRVDPAERISIIKSGVKPEAFGVIARHMDRTREQLGKTLGLSVTTIDRKQKAGENLSPEQSERVVAMAKLIGQVQAMVEESGDPEGFDAAHWLGRWLDEPLPALGGQRPADFMDTAEGRELVSRLLAMAQSGAYA